MFPFLQEEKPTVSYGFTSLFRRNCRTLVNVNNARTADNIPKRNYVRIVFSC